jgi:ubiquitin-protein ligase
VLHRIHNLLEVPDLDDMPVEPEIADQYKKDRSAYEAKAKEWTKLYATVKGESVASIAGTGA